MIVRLGDVADVVLGAENYDQDVLFNGESAVFMGIWVLPTANTLEVINRVRDALPGMPFPARSMKRAASSPSAASIQSAAASASC